MADDMLTILKEENTEFQAKKTELQFFLDSYEGGQDYLNSGAIFSHVRETTSDYNDRKKRACYFNYCQPIVDIYVSHLFKKPIARQSEGYQEALEAFWPDVDRRGHDLASFMKEEVAVPCQVFGYTFVLVDKPQYGPDILTRADEEALGGLPYFCAISPRSVINWSVDRYGKFYWLRYVEDVAATDDPFGSGKKTRRFWTWTRTEWNLHEEVKQEGGTLAVREVARGVHNLGEVPVVVFYNRRSKKYQVPGVSAIQDIAYINRSIINVCSLIDEFLYRQCFNMLAMPDEGKDVAEEQEVGVSNILYYPAGERAPTFVTPPTGPAEYMQAWIDTLKTEIYRLARIQHTDAVPREQSGVAKAWDFHETNQSLADKADNMQYAEQELWRFWLKWQDLKSDVTVDYPEEFDIKAVNAELEEALQLKALNISRTFTSEYMKKLVRRLDDKLPAGVLEKIDAEIDAVNAVLTPSEEDLARRAAERMVSGG